MITEPAVFVLGIDGETNMQSMQRLKCPIITCLIVLHNYYTSHTICLILFHKYRSASVFVSVRLCGDAYGSG